MSIEELFSENKLDIVRYWKDNNLKPSNFYCRECGKCMLDFGELDEIRYNPNLKNKQTILNMYENSAKQYVESDINRWLVKGRTLSGKTYFRHLCWDCFFKHLGEIEDIPKRARKSSWYKDINNGIFRPPATWTSPSKYFKILFDITDEELEREHKKFDTASFESFIRRYGEKNGPLKYDEYKKRQAYTCSKEYMMNEKGMTEDEWNNFNANRACTKENFIKRYGEKLGLEKWEDYCNLESYAGCKLEYFIERYGRDEGRKIYLELNKRKAQTLENYINKYGEVEGKRRYEDICNKMYSNLSKSIFDIIQKRLGNFAIGSRYAENEMAINISFDDGSCRVCYPDYLLHTKIIEFNGDYWHANPKFYSSESEMSFIKNSNAQTSKYNGIKAKDIWEYDKNKKKALEKLGYQVKVVWENDYHRDPAKIINECVEFLKS